MIQSSLVAAGRTAQQARHVLRSPLRCVRVPSSVNNHGNMISSSGCARFLATATWAPARGHGNKGFVESSSVSMKNRTLLFSTDSSSTSSGTPPANVEVTSYHDMPTSELLLAATQYTSQGDAFQAQQILEQLQYRNDVSAADVTKLATSIMTAWIENQSQCLTAFEESTCKHPGNHKVLLGHLEDICGGAEYATQLLEKHLLKGGSVFKPSSSQEHHLVAVLDAWAKASEAGRNANLPQSLTSSVTKGIPQRMQHLLQQPKLAPSTTTTTTTTTTTPTPTTTHSTDVYNQILKAWACSEEHLRGTMAEQIFQTIDEPNGESFRWIIRAWCWSKERRRAFTATGHYMRRIRLLELGQTDMEPTMEDYHILFEAWTKAEDKNAPSKALTVIQFMEDANRKELTTLRPDEQCYRDALITMSRRLNVPDVGELTDKVLASMKERAMVPDSSCYGAAILAWKNVATSRDCDDRDASAKRTLQLLREMTQAYYRTTTSLVKPTVENYNHVLEALGVVSMVTRATDDAEMLLMAMEEAAKQEEHGDKTETLDGNEPTGVQRSTVVLHPNADTYRLVLEVWRKSKSVDKVQHGRNVLQRMLSRLDDLCHDEAGDKSSFVEVFNAFIRVCAKPHIKDEAGKMKTMKLALQAADDMRKLGMDPNAGTYSALLEACHRLIPEGVDRSRILENVFRKCCEEGCVDQTVLEQFHSVASSYLYSKLVVGHGVEVEGIKVVPGSWTRTITKQGGKALPLSIDGKFTETIASKEYKMRKLRGRSNQRLLRGGRM